MAGFNCRIRNRTARRDWGKDEIPWDIPATGLLVLKIGEVETDIATLNVTGDYDMGLSFRVPDDGSYSVYGVYHNGTLVEVRIPAHKGWEKYT